MRNGRVDEIENSVLLQMLDQQSVNITKPTNSHGNLVQRTAIPVFFQAEIANDLLADRYRAAIRCSRWKNHLNALASRKRCAQDWRGFTDKLISRTRNALTDILNLRR